MSCYLREGLLGFDACKGGPRLVEYAKLRDKTLCLRAPVLDDVVDVCEASSEVIRSSLEPYVSFILRCPQKYMNGQDRVEVLWRTLLWDISSDQEGQLEQHAHDERGASFRSWLAFNICIGI